MKIIKLVLLSLVMLLGIKCGCVVNHQRVLHNSIKANVIIEGWGTVDTIFGPVESSWVGSGVIVDSDGLVITAKHLIEKARKLRVTLQNGSQFTIYLSEVSKKEDFGYFRLPCNTPDFVVIYDSSKVKRGTKLYNVGNALGIWDNSIFYGRLISNNFSRCFFDKAGTKFVFSDLNVVPGCSGGGVYTYSGKLIGIMSLTQGGGAFAVPSEQILKEL